MNDCPDCGHVGAWKPHELGQICPKCGYEDLQTPETPADGWTWRSDMEYI